jgi:phosphosulfolactate phosphohydrolase-like enzyme
LVCGGTHEEAAYEDVLCAGALCDLLWKDFSADGIADSAKMARALYQLAAKHLLSVASQSRNGLRLGRIPELRDDVPYCLQRDLFAFAAGLNRQGKVQKV